MENLNFEKLVYQNLGILLGEEPKTKTFLLGVSGGKDSMCMAHLFLKLNLKFCIAHINYQLRGTDSNLDMDFVINWCKKNKIQYFVKTVDEYETKEIEKGNLQNIARNIRYNFFEKVKSDQNLDFICVAHHASDWFETIVFNFFRGGILNAILGIPAQNGFILRPFIDIEESILINYVAAENIEFRIDLSNEKLDYSRNKIRHLITPTLKKINPSLIKTFLNNKKIWTELLLIKNEYLKSENQKILIQISTEEFLIDLAELKKCIAPNTFMFEKFIPLGFTTKLIQEILRMKEPFVSIGAFIKFNGWNIVKLEKHLRIVKDTKQNIAFSISEFKDFGDFYLNDDEELSIYFCDKIPKNLNAGLNKIFVDYQFIIFPILYRKWVPGDYFYPINMNNQKKKVKDFLTNLKIDKVKKEEVFVLTNGDGKIIWVVGMRQDDRFKLTTKTKQILIFEKKNIIS